MLIRFSVSGYRGFKDPIEIDFTDKKNYQFGKECVRGDFLDKVIIVGANGSGKTNFGYALMDIITTLTGFSKDIGQNEDAFFINGDNDSGIAVFHYDFTYRGTYINYEYGKASLNTIVCEKLVIDRETVFDYSLTESGNHIFNLDLVGASKIDPASVDGTRALLRMIIEDTYQDRYSVIRALSDFANHTLYYRAMWKKDEHIGILDSDDDIDRFILENGYIEDLTEFLEGIGVGRLNLAGINGKLVLRTRNKDLPFYTAASRGTLILCRLYCWIKRCSDKESLMFFDDFDDMYHYQLAESVMKWIINSNKAQCIFVTHNTGLISNEFMRPDCCFILDSGEISSLASRTEKDLRRGHNLEKMLRDGEFDRSKEE